MRFRNLLRVLLFFLLSDFVLGQALEYRRHVQGNLFLPPGTAAQNSRVRIQLKYCSGNVGRVPVNPGNPPGPSGIIVSFVPFEVNVQANGSWGTDLYGNDQILCGTDTSGPSRWLIQPVFNGVANAGGEYQIQSCGVIPYTGCSPFLPDSAPSCSLTVTTNCNMNGGVVGPDTWVTVNGVVAVPNALDFNSRLLPPAGSTPVTFQMNGNNVSAYVTSSGGGGGGGGITGATPGGGLLQSGSTLGLLTNCTANQYLSWSGTAWICTTLTGGGGGGSFPTIPTWNLFASTGAGGAQDSGVAAQLGFLRAQVLESTGDVNPGAPSGFTPPNGSIEYFPTGSYGIGGANGLAIHFSHSSISNVGAPGYGNGGIALGGGNATGANYQIYLDCESAPLGCDFKVPLTVNGGSVGGGGGGGLPTIPVYNLFASSGSGTAQDSAVRGGNGYLQAGVLTASATTTGNDPFTVPNASLEWFPTGAYGISAPNGAAFLFGHGSGSTSATNGGVVLAGGNTIGSGANPNWVYVSCLPTGTPAQPVCDFKYQPTVNGNPISGGGGGGSGTVNPGTPSQFALYTGSTTVSSNPHLDDGLTTAAVITSTEEIDALSYKSTGPGGLALTSGGGALPAPIAGGGGIGIDAGGVPKIYTSGGGWQQIATTGAGGAVSSVFGRTGAVAATSGDYTVAQVTGAAPLASPALTGTPTAPTPLATDNSTAIATTAWVTAHGGGGGGGGTQPISPGAQAGICGADSSLGASPVTLTIPSLTIHTNDTVIVTVHMYTSTNITMAVSDNGAGGSNAYTMQVAQPSAGGSASVQIFTSAIGAAHAASTLTVTKTGTGTTKFVACVATYTGVVSVGTTPGTNTGNSASMSVTLASVAAGHYMYAGYVAIGATTVGFTSPASPASLVFTGLTTTPQTVSATACLSPATAGGALSCTVPITASTTWGAAAIELIGAAVTTGTAVSVNGTSAGTALNLTDSSVIHYLPNPLSGGTASPTIVGSGLSTDCLLGTGAFGPCSASPMIWPAATGVAVYGGSNAWSGSYNGTNPIPANFVAGTNGNAATATQFLTAPSICSAGHVAQGITITGSATGCTALSSSLSDLTAATAQHGIANGTWPQLWQWAQTTDGNAAMTFGESAASTGGTLAASGTPIANQSNLTISTAAGSTATPLNVNQGALSTGTAYPAMQVQTAWNGATGNIFRGILFNATGSGSQSSIASLLLDLQFGGQSQFAVNRIGNVELSASGGYVGSATNAGSTLFCGSSVTSLNGSCGSNASGRAGGTMLQGGDNSLASSGSFAGYGIMRGGMLSLNTGNTSVGTEGVTEVVSGYMAGGTSGNKIVASTLGIVACPDSTPNSGQYMVHDCPTGAQNVVGIANTGTNANPVAVVSYGTVPVQVDAAVTAIGDIICTSQTVAGQGHDTGTTACASPAMTIGVVIATSGTPAVAAGNGVSSAVTLSTTLPLVQLRIGK